MREDTMFLREDTMFLVYKDIISKDELLTNAFPYTELFEGVLWEVEGKWIVEGVTALEITEFDIGAYLSAEGGDEELVEDQVPEVVDLVHIFRLQELPPFDKKTFVEWVKRYIKLITPKLDAKDAEVFTKNIEPAAKFLMSKIADLQFYVGETKHVDGAIVFSYYKDGSTSPTFLYLAHGLEEVNCSMLV